MLANGFRGRGKVCQMYKINKLIAPVSIFCPVISVCIQNKKKSQNIDQNRKRKDWKNWTILDSNSDARIYELKKSNSNNTEAVVAASEEAQSCGFL